MRKQSFLERLTGTQTVGEEDLLSASTEEDKWDPNEYTQAGPEETLEIDEPEYEDGDDDVPGLAVDIYESDNELVLQSMIAGVTPENLHISITRDTVTIKGRRNAPTGIDDDQYVFRELYWGPFSREIQLPCEVDTDGAEAVEKYGLLIIRLPMLDTNRKQELRVKSISRD